jgi:NAD(P)-dependent dehydrogenase (short-subunit alcohol dehydrogenase family)
MKRVANTQDMPESRVVIVTGAARGLGLSLVHAFIAEGWRVFATARRGQYSSELASHPRFSSCRLDVTSSDECDVAARRCIETFGRCDVLVNNASGFMGGKSAGTYSGQEIRDELMTTLGGAINMTNAFVSAVRERDTTRARRAIIFVSSVSGLPHEPGNGRYAVYAAAKAGVARFAQCVREDLADE